MNTVGENSSFNLNRHRKSIRKTYISAVDVLLGTEK